MINQFLLACMALLSCSLAYGQHAVLAYPLTNITIDGDLSDWPKEAFKYNITHDYAPAPTSYEDLTASFMVGYDGPSGMLYVAVEVIDDHYVGQNGQGHGTQDHALLYLDKRHDKRGGAPLFYVAADEYIELLKKSASVDPVHADFTLESAEVKTQYVGNRLIYEWKVALGAPITPNQVIGMDHFIIDQDEVPGQQGNYLWKDGFGKSMGTQRLGSVVFLEKGAVFGKMTGRVNTDGIPRADRVDELHLQSTVDDQLWTAVQVDTNGYFQAFLPVGEYQVQPSKRFTSPVGSSGFKQNTRKYQYTTLPKATIEAGKTVAIDPVEVKILPRPVQEVEAGLLWSEGALDTKRVEDYIQTWQEYLEIPAVSVVLIKDGKEAYRYNKGVKNTITKEPVYDRTLFEAASISKPVFGVMVLRLAERGVIDLDKPLYQYLPFPNLTEDERAKLLTARIILNHQSGLSNWIWGGPGTWQNGGPAKLNFEPGTAFGYSGEAFNYLGRVIEHLTGKKLPQIFQEEIAIPFGLKDTYYHYEDVQEALTAQGHLHQYPNYKVKEYLPSPASSVTTNAVDFQHFAIGLMNEQHLKPSSYQLIYTPATVLEKDQKIYDPDLPQYLSHSFFVQETPRGKLIAHGGNNGDYDCKFAFNPDHKISYLIFTNSNLGDEFARALEVFLVK